MLNSIRETRLKREDLYSVMLEVPEKEYFDIYDSVTDDNAADILQQYMVYHGDDGRYSDLRIQHNKELHIISIFANLHYTENGHTEQFNIPHLEDYFKGE